MALSYSDQQYIPRPSPGHKGENMKTALCAFSFLGADTKDLY
jgi:hypothetical protein